MSDSLRNSRRDRLGRRLASDGQRLVLRRSGNMRVGLVAAVAIVAALFVIVPTFQSYTKRRVVVTTVTCWHGVDNYNIVGAMHKVTKTGWRTTTRSFLSKGWWSVGEYPEFQ